MESEFHNYKIETAFNSMTLHRTGRLLELRSRDGALQSRLDCSAPHRLAMPNLEYLLAALLFVPPPRRILLLGVAGGGLVHFLGHHFDVDITAVDIDAELSEKLIEFGILPPAGNGLTYVYADAKRYLEAGDEGYDLVLVDLFSGAHSPRWLLDKRVLGHLRRLLAARGALAFNLLVASETDFTRFYRDLRLVFARRTLCVPIAGLDNVIAFAFDEAPPQRDLQAWREHAQALGSTLGIDLPRILAAIFGSNPLGGGLL